MRFPFKSFFEATGAIGVKRSRSSNLVSDLVELLRDKEMALMISPEGTRKETTKWKTGFYHIAMGAGVPLVVGMMDYSSKSGGLGPAIWPTGDYVADMKKVAAIYATVVPKHPAKGMTDIIAKDEA